jgi:diguanylate cyclase (GGDEF)-like protein
LKRLLATLQQPVCIEGKTMEISASIGVSFYPSLAGDLEADQVLRRADQAMYHAKRIGRNGYSFENEAYVLANDPDSEKRFDSLQV